VRRGPRRPAHRATSRHLQAAYPFVTEGGLGTRGVYIGRDHHRATFAYDAFELYAAGRLHGPNMLVVGQLGSAKSSLVKTLISRARVFARRAAVVDPKGEYAPLAASFATHPIRLARGGQVRLNPLDPRISGQHQRQLLRSVAAVVLGRELHPGEWAALDAAHLHAGVLAGDRGEQPTVPLVIHALFHPDQQAAAQLSTTPEQLAGDGRQVALGLRDLTTGELAGMFDGPTSAQIDLDARLVCFDLSDVARSRALPVLMACTTTWLRDVWVRADGIKRLMVLDEAWMLLKDPAIARWLEAGWKLARRDGVQYIAVLHRLSDLHAAGDAGSQQVALAKGLLADSETCVIYRQSPGELERARELLGLTQTEVDQLLTLPRGVALWRVGQHAAIVRHHIDPTYEATLIDTDQAMTTQALAAAHGIRLPAPDPGELLPDVAAPPTPNAQPGLDGEPDAQPAPGAAPDGEAEESAPATMVVPFPARRARSRSPRGGA
jgi:hypothetical protein